MVVGRIQGEKVYGTNGRYVGTIVSGRLVYRSTDCAGVSSPFSSANRAGTARANCAGSATWGNEPDIPDWNDIRNNDGSKRHPIISRLWYGKKKDDGL